MSARKSPTKKRAAAKKKRAPARKSSGHGATARAIWKGNIKFGTIDVPVKLYSAVQDRDIHFRLLHKTDKEPVKQVMVNPETGDVVPSESTQKAFDDEDVLVLLDDEELESLEPEPSRDIEVLRFVGPEDITHQWYDRPYYLGPDSSNAAYFTLAQALANQDKRGIARWVMRNREYIGALVPEGDYLLLITLRNAEEIILATSLEPPAGRKPDPRELKLAEQLISALQSDFDPAEFRDEYRERLLDFIAKKANGKAPKIRKLRPKRETTKSLADVLQASLKTTVKERKSA